MVNINGKIAKPASNVKEGDILEIKLRGKLTTIRVLEVKEFAKVEETSSMYEVINEQVLENENI